MNLPSAEIKKAVSVRSDLPDESNTVIQKTAGRTLFSNRDRSRVGPCPAPACVAWMGAGAGVGAWAELETMGGEGDCAAGDSPTSWRLDFRPHPAVAKIASESEHPRIRWNGLIGG